MNKQLCCIVFCMAAILSCSKSNDSHTVCKIIAVTSPGDDPTSFTYNKDGKPVEINYGKFKTTFSYSGNATTILQTNNGVFWTKWIVQLNNKGVVEKVRNLSDESGTTWIDETYLYAADQLQKITSVNQSGVVTRVASYTWNNGNPVLITFSNGDPEVKMEYYTDRLHDPGVKLVEGTYWDGAPPKNLIKVIDYSGDAFTKTYQFDATGKVIAQTIMQNSRSTTYQYGYDCDQ